MAKGVGLLDEYERYGWVKECCPFLWSNQRESIHCFSVAAIKHHDEKTLVEEKVTVPEE